MWPHSLAVRTQGFHPCGRGSTPLGVKVAFRRGYSGGNLRFSHRKLSPRNATIGRVTERPKVSALKADEPNGFRGFKSLPFRSCRDSSMAERLICNQDVAGSSPVPGLVPVVVCSLAGEQTARGWGGNPDRSNPFGLVTRKRGAGTFIF